MHENDTEIQQRSQADHEQQDEIINRLDPNKVKCCSCSLWYDKDDTTFISRNPMLYAGMKTKALSVPLCKGCHYFTSQTAEREIREAVFERVDYEIYKRNGMELDEPPKIIPSPKIDNKAGRFWMRTQKGKDSS